MASSPQHDTGNRLQQPEHGLELFARFDDHPDPGGLAHRAGAASAATGALAQADRLLDRAMREATKTGTIDPDFHILKAQIYEARAGRLGDDETAASMLESAAGSYDRALRGGHEGDAIAFNLARLQAAIGTTAQHRTPTGVVGAGQSQYGLTCATILTMPQHQPCWV